MRESRFKTLFNAPKLKPGQLIVMITFMILPLILLLVFTYIPFAKMVSFSFYNMSYTRNKGFVGLDNYVKVFKRDDCFKALRLSLYYMVGSVVQLTLALFLASILSQRIKGSYVFRGLMFFPFLISGIAVGFIFKFFYTHGFVLDTVLTSIGFDLDSLPYWLRDQRINNWSLVATSVWRYFGQNMVLFIGAIMSIDQEMYEAAILDGATEFQKFIYITLPNIKTIFVLNVIMSISGSLSAFEPPYVITDGANGTGTYFVIMHQIAHTQNKLGLASAMAVVLLLIIILVTVLQNLFFNRTLPSDEYGTKKKNMISQ
ncbi:MAG: sugar ABC transporter permease [Eubacterium sp.]|nr:sugar ABC transporter permease [Eubacterium sp.]